MLNKIGGWGCPTRKSFRFVSCVRRASTFPFPFSHFPRLVLPFPLPPSTPQIQNQRAQMLASRFWLQNEDLWTSLLAMDLFFEIYLFRATLRSRNLFAQKTRAPARNSDPNTTAFSGHVFPGKQKPLLGAPTPSTTAFFRSCFSQKTKAPARNADPGHHGFFRNRFSPKFKPRPWKRRP